MTKAHVDTGGITKHVMKHDMLNEWTQHHGKLTRVSGEAAEEMAWIGEVLVAGLWTPGLSVD